MKSFFPTPENISSQWRLSEFKAQNDVDIEDSDETANIVARAYVVDDSKDSESNILVNLSLFEFTSPQIADDMQKRIFDKFFAFKDISPVIQIDGFENCLGSVTNPNMTNEESYVSCVDGSFVVISQSTQNGFVYEQGNKLETSRISLAFATFVLNQLPEENIIPHWIKNNAGWWADGTIDDASFISGIQFLVENGIISVS